MGPSAPVQEILHQSVCQLQVRRLDIFFSSIHGTFSMTDHMLGHETSLNKEKTEIISSIFFLPYHNGMILEINNSNKTGKFTDIWNLNTFLNNQWINEEIKRQIKNILKQWKWKHNISKLTEQKSISKGEGYSKKHLRTKKDNKYSNQPSNFTP